MNLYKNISIADRKDIVELEQNIEKFKAGTYDEERFKLYRLTRGVYGQRQLGVQMFRIKIPYGSLSSDQLRVIADISDKYASSNLHLTTRQDIQLHYVRLEDSPQVWRALTNNGLTGREACGNTVRNITASPTAGIDPFEPFDVTPYAEEAAYYFMRNPICQEMGRKIKPSFSSSFKDTAFSFFHDFGLIPKVKEIDGHQIRGFEVYIGGGLGAQAIAAQKAYDFLPSDQLIPFMEASIRVFDRYGEREKRQKARMKFLIKKLGVDVFLDLVKNERSALKFKTYPIDGRSFVQNKPIPFFEPEIKAPKNKTKYTLWYRTNVFEQKQKGYYGVYIKVLLGDISSDNARLFAPIIKKYTSDDVRITINQGLLLKFVDKRHLPELYEALDQIGYAQPGFDSIGDVTACPGTDTCNLGVTNSTGLSREIERFITTYYEHLLEEKHIKIKISGCMNACGQHMIANIGFHGSSIKKDQLVIPAMQVVIGGGLDPTGKGWIAQKIIKLPTKRILQCVSILLDDFDANKIEDEYYNNYFERLGKKYFYHLLKPLADISTLTQRDYFDWEQDHNYKQAIGVGECAGVILDVVGTIIKDAQDKLTQAQDEFDQHRYPESIYYAYTSYVIGAKALLLSEDIKCNTQIKILDDFQELFIDTKKFNFIDSFKDHVLSINRNDPSSEFALNYLSRAFDFFEKIVAHREHKISTSSVGKKVIANYYKA